MRKYVHVDIRKDGLVASLMIFPDAENKKPLIGDALAELERAGVKFGLDEEAVSRALDADFGVRTVVATGKAPEPGKDASIDMLVSPALNAPKVDADGRVDYRDLQLVKNVVKGQILAEKIPPVRGKHGMDVKRVPIDPPEPLDPPLPAGENTLVTPDGLKLISIINGHLTIGRDAQAREVVNVNEVFELNSHVDTSTGNLDCIGSCVIGGVVREGFKVVANGDITVKGQVEGAHIESREGTVVLERGIKGQTKGIVRAAKDVRAKYIENSTIEADGDILILEHAYHSNLRCLGSIRIIKKDPGAIMGGTVAFKSRLQCRQLGSETEPRTEIYFGDWKVADAVKRLEEVAILLDELAPQADAMREELREMRRLSMEDEEKHKDRIAALARNAGAFPRITERIEELTAEKAVLEKKIDLSDAKIIAEIEGMLHRGVVLLAQGVDNVDVKKERRGLQITLKKDTKGVAGFSVKPLRGA